MSNIKPKTLSNELDALELLDREELIKMVKRMASGGVSLMFRGKRTAQEICRRVRPRATRIIKNLCCGSAEDQSKNLLIEGENLQAMVTLYKYRGEVDLIVTDPPYNTGNDFRYNDRWDEDPNDPDLGNLVPADDGSRHTKWLRFMTPRLYMMKEMLKPGGVIAICIDYRELFRLGMLMDEVFDEANRIGIINWQKNYSPKSSSGHVSISTEYVLVYAKDKERATTNLLARTEEMNARYTNPDGDPDGQWTGDNITGSPHKKKEDYGIQSPFTGEILYPTNRWRLAKQEMKRLLEEWGMEYVAMKDPNATLPSLVLKGTKLQNGRLVTPEEIKAEAREKAIFVRDNKVWPRLFFLSNGEGGPRIKRYIDQVKKGKIPMTYWADEEYETPFILGTQSWEHTESGHSQTGINELDNIVGPNHGFETVKPLKLIKKIIQLWCPSQGLILDPFAGSGTTGHAVLEINEETDTKRRFILIEQGSPEKGDKYARTLTRERVCRAITGERSMPDGTSEVKAKPLGGGFEFRMLLNQIDAKAVLSMKREELIDVVLASHWDEGHRSDPNLIRLEGFSYLAGKNAQNEGYFIIWNGPDSVGQLDIDTYGQLLQEAKRAKLKAPYHVYARYELYQSKNVEFYKIPDKILAHLGLNEFSSRYNEAEEGDDE